MSEPITDPSSETAYLRLIEDHTTFLATKAEYISSKTYNKHSNDCGPVAATNYCAFYAKVHGIKFSRDWEAIYDDLYDLSGTNGSGTDAKRLAKAMEQTWEKESRPRKITNLDEIDWGDAFEDVLHPLLANDKGVIIYLENNSCYGDHFVFGYGYQMYKYNNVRRNYIHIKDGETVSHERYIFVDKTIKAMIY